MKILITGGHVTPALAVIDELISNEKQQVLFVGRKHALLFDKEQSYEYQQITKLGIKFVNLNAGRLTRSINLISFINILFIPIGFIQAFFIVLRYRPDRVLSFGGYLGLPVVMASFLLRISVIIHEQTLKPGIANRLSGLFAKYILLSFPETKTAFSGNKTIITGNPLRQSLLNTTNHSDFIRKPKQKIIYITGGSLGSKTINKLIEEILPLLTKDFFVIHQCGSYNNNENYNRLISYKKGNYLVKPHFDDWQVGQIYKKANLVIGRSGANTVMELIAFQLPSILIPLSIASFQEQREQALLLKTAGAAEILSDERSSKELYQIIKTMDADLNKYKNNFSKLMFYYHPDAAKKIISILMND